MHDTFTYFKNETRKPSEIRLRNFSRNTISPDYRQRTYPFLIIDVQIFPLFLKPAADRLATRQNP